jgi:hypothetical protein
VRDYCSGFYNRAFWRLGGLRQPNSGGPPLKKAGFRLFIALIGIVPPFARHTIISIIAHSCTEGGGGFAWNIIGL